ncbi:unnamed protein product, partial [Pylaiella littoralis]
MPGSSTSLSLAASAVLFLARVTSTAGHAFQTKPVSRQFLHTSYFNDGQNGISIEKHADAYNGGGPGVVKARQLARTDPDVLAKYGDGNVWPIAAAWDLGERCSNGNYLENDDIAVSHGVCGDTPQSGDDAPITYSTPNSEWEPLAQYTAGDIMEMDIILTNYHWGHMEFFLCCTSDLDDPDGVAKQSCFNKYPLDRADDDSYNSPVDPDYPGRYYVDPPCRGGEVDQTRPELQGVLNDGNVMHMRYKLPNIECDHAILMMRYHSGKGCRSPGYEEFNPSSWPSECAPDKEDWIAVTSHPCNSVDREWGNIFWNCADITLTSGEKLAFVCFRVRLKHAIPYQGWTVLPVASKLFRLSPSVPALPCLALPGMPDSTLVTVVLLPAASTLKLCPRQQTAGGSPGPSPGPSPGSSPGPDSREDSLASYSHVGCFADMKADRVFGSSMTSNDMSTAMCSAHCAEEGAVYMATQYGNECWCSQDEDLDYARHSESGECDMSCSGNSGETCGGFLVFDLYKTGGYMGCFADDTDDRVLGNEITGQGDMTPDVCREHCENYGSFYYATQYGHECWCGDIDSIDHYTQNGSGSCSSDCAGDSSIACGEPSRNR